MIPQDSLDCVYLLEASGEEGAASLALLLVNRLRRRDGPGLAALLEEVDLDRLTRPKSLAVIEKALAAVDLLPPLVVATVAERLRVRYEGMARDHHD